MQGFIFYFRLRNKITSKHWSAWNHKQVWLLQIQYNLKPTYKILLKNILKSKSYVCIDTHTHTHTEVVPGISVLSFYFPFLPLFKWWQMPLTLIHIKIFFSSEAISVVLFFFFSFSFKWFSVDKATREQTHKVASIEKATLN